MAWFRHGLRRFVCYNEQTDLGNQRMLLPRFALLAPLALGFLTFAHGVQASPQRTATIGDPARHAAAGASGRLQKWG